MGALPPAGGLQHARDAVLYGTGHLAGDGRWLEPGSWVAALVAPQLPLDAALLVEPSAKPGLGACPQQVVFPARRAPCARPMGPSQAALESYLAPMLPMNLQPQIPLTGVRTLAARYDLLVGYQPVLALWRAWGQPTLNVQSSGQINLLFTAALIYCNPYYASPLGKKWN